MTCHSTSPWKEASTAIRRGSVILGVVGFALACGDSPRDVEVPAERAESVERANASPTPDEREFVDGPIDESLADRGESAFTQKGCVACHYVGREDRLVGPDLAGVPQRRRYSWYRAMVSNPDSMLRADETARAMLAEYMTPMPKQGLTEEEIRAIWEYLRRETGAGGGR